MSLNFQNDNAEFLWKKCFGKILENRDFSENCQIFPKHKNIPKNTFHRWTWRRGKCVTDDCSMKVKFQLPTLLQLVLGVVSGDGIR